MTETDTVRALRDIGKAINLLITTIEGEPSESEQVSRVFDGQPVHAPVPDETGYPKQTNCPDCNAPIYIQWSSKTNKEYRTQSPRRNDFHNCPRKSW